ncbi:MAG: hypothetical protein KF726_23640 [Anaerolineae bacterium]|nr:hypothetical protein [Anaerolineae bacterium]
MMIRQMKLMAAVLITCIVIAGSLVAAAQTPTGTIRVGVLLSLRGEVSTYCLDMPANANGLDALEATGIDVAAQRGPLGAAVCRIQNVGCTPPGDTCFCQCQGNRCNYWAYYYQEEQRWLYSNNGALNRKLFDGAVDGWLWSEGTGSELTPAGSLPTTTFDEICAAPSGNSDVLTAPSVDAGTLLAYGLFVVAAIGLGGALLWRRTKAQS